MPVIDGKVVRARYTHLKLHELSSVDRPAQPGAKMTIMKRDTRGEELVEIAKYVCEDDGAHSFSQVLTENKFSEQIWPYTDAFTQSIRSIVGDKGLSGADRDAKITASVGEFLAAVRTISPDTEKQLAELINKRDVPMPKTVEQLEGEVSTLKSQLETSASQLAIANKSLEDLKAEADAKGKEAEETKKALAAATDEVITVGGQELRKSEVGAANFTMAKAMRDERDTAIFEKRASEEFPNLVGTTTEKALVLKSIETLPEDAKKAATAILTAAEKMTAAGFDRIGTGGGNNSPTEKAAEAGFMTKVAEVQKRDGIKQSDAMSKARQEFPEEFAAYTASSN